MRKNSDEATKGRSDQGKSNAHRRVRTLVSCPFVALSLRRSVASSRSGLSYVAVLVFLLLFALLLIGVSHYYLLPALDAARNASPDQKRRLMAVSRLVLALVLFTLFAMLMLTFKVGRFFLPRPVSPRTRTGHIDAWAEAGQRLQEPDDDEE